MSTIWTPDGEREVPRVAPTPPTAGAGASPAGSAAGSPGGEELSPEQAQRLEEAAREVAEIRAQLAAAPPELVVANHVMGLYELAAIHLSQEPPNLVAARLAVDALAAVLSACQGRLGEAEGTLVEARTQIQLAFVQRATPR